MNGVFISYRREDSEGFARSLFQSLTLHFGVDQIFMDVEDIELGLDFVDAIDRSLSSCGVLLVLIGKEWSSCVDSEGRRRLDNPEDFVRMEVASALRRNIRVIPVLVRGAAMPGVEDLPDDLKSLARRQALELRHDRWDSDVERLIAALEKTLGAAGGAPKTQPGGKQAHSVSSTGTGSGKAAFSTGKIAGIAVAVVVVLALAFGFSGDDSTSVSPAPPPASRQPEVVQPAPGGKGAVSNSAVYKAQELLAELGYDPGPIDGREGAKTANAVRQFQRNLGITADGRIDSELVERLDEAYRYQAYSAPQATPAPTVINLSGNWVDEAGYRYVTVQQGSRVQSQAFYPVVGTPAGVSEGTLNGRVLEYRFIAVDGSQGVGRGLVSEDGQSMEYVLTNLTTGMQNSGVIYRQ